jgi:hypothetical protein
METPQFSHDQATSGGTYDKYYFDTEVRELLDDETALKRIEAGDETVRHIGSLLLDAEFPYQAAPVDHASSEQHWTRDGLLQIGRWALRAMQMVRVEETNNRSQLTRTHLERLRTLAIGPSRYWFKRHFKTMWQYREELGIHAGHDIGKYSDWSRLDYIAHAYHLSGNPKRRLKEEDFDKAHQAGEGPASTYITHFLDGGISSLNEALGFPDVKSWEQEDFVLWGARVMEANDGVVNKYVIDELSKRDRGPSTTTVSNKFDQGLREFKREAKAIWLAKKAQEAKIRQGLLSDFDELFSLGEFPLETAEADEDAQISMAAKYKLATVALPRKDGTVWAKVAQASSRALITTIRHYDRGNRQLTPGYIELLASTHEVFDVIWPMLDYMDYLKVPKEVLARGRVEAKARWAQIKEQRASN